MYVEGNLKCDKSKNYLISDKLLVDLILYIIYAVYDQMFYISYTQF